MVNAQYDITFLGDRWNFWGTLTHSLENRVVLKILVFLLELIKEGRLVWERVELARGLVLDFVT